MRGSFVFGTAQAAALLTLALTASAGPLSERITFVSDPTGLPKIWVVRPDGKDLRRLTRTLGHEREPRLSLPARAVAFRGNKDGNEELYRVDLEGEETVRLTHSDFADRSPSWSPDGQRIVFSTTRYGNEELAIIDSRTGDTDDITRLTWDLAVARFPDWSPDGQWIVYTSYRNDDGELYKVRPDGSDNSRLTFSVESEVNAAWSPDGTKIAYETRYGPRDKPTLAVLDVATQESTMLTEIPERAHYPRWSPDGQYLIFSADGTRYEPKALQLQLYSVQDASVRIMEFDPLTPGRLPLAPSESDWTRYPLPW